MRLPSSSGQLFGPIEIDPGTIPIAAQNMLLQRSGEGLELTRVIIERNTTFDSGTHPVLDTYAESARSEGGYIVYALDGTLLSDSCD